MVRAFQRENRSSKKERHWIYNRAAPPSEAVKSRMVVASNGWEREVAEALLAHPDYAVT